MDTCRDAGVLTSGSGDSAIPVKRSKRTVAKIELEKLRRQNGKLKSEVAKTQTALDTMGRGARALERSLRERPRTSWYRVHRTASRLDFVQKSCVLTGISRATHSRQANPQGPMHGP